MGNKYYLIAAYVALAGVIIASSVTVYTLLPRAGKTNLVAPAADKVPEVKKIEVHLYKKQGSLILRWANLPQGTERVDIFRSVRGTNKWEKWKSVAVGEIGIVGGELQIKISSREDLDKYSFYAQAIGNPLSGNGTSTGALTTGPASYGGQSGMFTNANGETVLWISEETVAETYVPPPSATPPPSQTPPPTGETNGQDGPFTIPPIPSPGSTSTPAAPQNASSSPPPQTIAPQDQPGSGSQNQIIYYSPNGQISGYGSSEPLKNFWVDHVNKSIEIGWQGIPAETTLAIVYRSSSENGPWAELLRQNNPQTSYLIRLLDNTLDHAYYYKLEARAGGNLLHTYGPEFLPALE